MIQMAQQAILTTEEKNALKEAQRILGRAVDLIARKMRCGENCDHYRQQVEELQAKLEAYITHFG